MTQTTKQRTFWVTIRQGWKASVAVGLAVLLIRFKALIPLVWQILVRNGSVHTISKGVGDLVVIVGGLICIYAVRTGYRRVSQTLEADNAAGSGTALRVIGQTSLFINAPILYWALFLFVLLPQLVKIPNASLRIGTTAALAGAFLSMAVIVVLAAHIGLLLLRFSLKSLMKTPMLTVAPNAVSGPQFPYVQPITQPNPYGAQGVYYTPAQAQGIPGISPPPGATPTQAVTYVPQSSYRVTNTPVANSIPGAQAPTGPGSPDNHTWPWR